MQWPYGIKCGLKPWNRQNSTNYQTRMDTQVQYDAGGGHMVSSAGLKPWNRQNSTNYQTRMDTHVRNDACGCHIMF
jgi:hypothetical protein